MCLNLFNRILFLQNCDAVNKNDNAYLKVDLYKVMVINQNFNEVKNALDGNGFNSSHTEMFGTHTLYYCI